MMSNVKNAGTGMKLGSFGINLTPKYGSQKSQL